MKKSIRKKRIALALSLTASMLLFSITGCGKQQPNSRLQSTNQVENAIKEQMKKEDGSTAKEALVVTTEETTTETTNDTTTTEVTTTSESTAEIVTSDTLSTTEEKTSMEASTADVDPSTLDYTKVDIDLTAMGKDMVYSTVYQMVYNPQDYIGKTVRMKGQYYVAYSQDPENDNFYNYCLIADAQACCQQGLEFVCTDGHDTYPDDFPEDGSEVEVTGVFEMYEEDGYMFLHLNYADMVVVN